MIAKYNNVAYIDGQNLYMGTTRLDLDPWEIDLQKLRIYLRDKYRVYVCYYFLGFVNEDHYNLYSEIQKAGFVLRFREHNSAMLGMKKGNVDSDIIFHVMKSLYQGEILGKIVLVSGDGDYKILVDFLIQEDKFEKILFPNQERASSLYRKIDLKFRADLSAEGIKKKIKKERSSLGS